LNTVKTAAKTKSKINSSSKKTTKTLATKISGPAETVIQLQETIGNQAILSLLRRGSVQFLSTEIESHSAESEQTDESEQSAEVEEQKAETEEKKEELAKKEKEEAKKNKAEEAKQEEKDKEEQQKSDEASEGKQVEKPPSTDEAVEEAVVTKKNLTPVSTINQPAPNNLSSALGENSPKMLNKFMGSSISNISSNYGSMGSIVSSRIQKDAQITQQLIPPTKVVIGPKAKAPKVKDGKAEAKEVKQKGEKKQAEQVLTPEMKAKLAKLPPLLRQKFLARLFKQAPPAPPIKVARKPNKKLERSGPGPSLELKGDADPNKAQQGKDQSSQKAQQSTVEAMSKIGNDNSEQKIQPVPVDISPQIVIEKPAGKATTSPSKSMKEFAGIPMTTKARVANDSASHSYFQSKLQSSQKSILAENDAQQQSYQETLVEHNKKVDAMSQAAALEQQDMVEKARDEISGQKEKAIQESQKELSKNEQVSADEQQKTLGKVKQKADSEQQHADGEVTKGNQKATAKHKEGKAKDAIRKRRREKK